MKLKRFGTQGHGLSKSEQFREGNASNANTTSISVPSQFHHKADQTCYQSDQSDEGLQIDLSEAIVRSDLFGLFAKTRVMKSDLIDLDKIELSEFKLT
jgi:hypothetical protein